MGFVYIFKNGNEDLYKIGKSGDSSARLSHLSTGNPHLAKIHEIETEHHQECETHLHNWLRSKRFRSQAAEFYKLEPQQLNDVIAEAIRFLREVLPLRLAVVNLKDSQTDGTIAPSNSEASSLYQKIVLLREQRYRVQIELELLENQLRLQIGNADGIDGIATWKTVRKCLFDIDRFIQEQGEELYERYKTKQYSSRSFNLL